MLMTDTVVINHEHIDLCVSGKSIIQKQSFGLPYSNML